VDTERKGGSTAFILQCSFSPDKQSPDRGAHDVEITHVYGREEADEFIARSREDYDERFPHL